MACLLISSCSSSKETLKFHPGKVWYDTDKKVINAHGGGILYHNGMYYWYGEYKKGKTRLPKEATWECYRTDVVGVSCYSSKNLYDWQSEGIVLEAEKTDSLHDLHPSKVVERPKVIYNARTGKFVMWMHVDSENYSKACVGVAISNLPTGPFHYLGSFRPNGRMSRDQTLFVDDDGRAYQVSSSEDNATMYVHLLSDDYLQPTNIYTRNFTKAYREAPAVFKHNGKYYLLTSGCSGWDPNVAEMAVADSMLGKWEKLGTPCVGKDSDKTFHAQSTFVQPIIGHPGQYIAMFDRWKKTNLQASRYIWLPLSVEGERVKIVWNKEWSY